MTQLFAGDFSLLDSEQSHKFISNLIVLNSPIHPLLLTSLVSHSQNIILADGGANQFYNIVKNHQLIECIVGDLDSIEKSILDYYKGLGVKIYQMEDQDSSDLQKALNKIQEKERQGVICIVGGNGDRIDHNFMIYSILTRTGRQYKNSEVFLINNCGIMLYLKPNKQYKVKMSKFEIKKGCGVITFSKVNEITTKGLKWDMGKDQFVGSLEFGEMLSTSNERVADEVDIVVSDEAFWLTHISLN